MTVQQQLLRFPVTEEENTQTPFIRKAMAHQLRHPTFKGTVALKFDLHTVQYALLEV